MSERVRDHVIARACLLASVLVVLGWAGLLIYGASALAGVVLH